MIKPIESKDIKELAKNNDNNDDATKLSKKMDYMIKSEKKTFCLKLTSKVKYLKDLKLIENL